MIEIVIPNWRPASANRLMGVHWSTKHKLKKADKITVGLNCKGIRQATGKRRVTVEMCYKHPQKEYDKDNVWKSLLDALVQNAMLIDDKPEFCEHGEVTQIKTTFTQTKIILEDI